MKVKNLPSLHLRKKTLDDIDFDHVAAISSDEFNSPAIPGDKKDYRNRAIDRLIENKLSFWNNNNLTWDIVKRFVQITCPYCEHPMNYCDGGGSANVISSRFKCLECGAEAGLTLVNDDGLYFRPKSLTEEE